MTDETVAPEQDAPLANFKGTFSFEHKVSDGNYGSNTYGNFVQYDYAPGCEPEEFLAAAREAANWAKMATYEAAGTDFYRDDSGVIRAVLQEFPGAVVESGAIQQSTVTNSSVPAEPPYTEDQIKAMSDDDAKEAKRAVKEWAAARLGAFPSEFYDNRATKKGNQPDYRHKKFGHAVLWA